METNHTYSVNKGTGKTVEFTGLKSQYLIAFFAGIFVLFMLFVILRICGTPIIANFGIVLILGLLLIYYVFKLNKKYGTHGLMKMTARKRVPRHLSRITSYRNILQTTLNQ
jgi:xanthosine utilization system XapX-like protein